MVITDKGNKVCLWPVYEEYEGEPKTWYVVRGYFYKRNKGANDMGSFVELVNAKNHALVLLYFNHGPWDHIDIEQCSYKNRSKSDVKVVVLYRISEKSRRFRKINKEKKRN